MHKLLGDAAHEAGVYLLADATVIGADNLENRAWLFAPSGGLIADYAKKHLLPGFEACFKPGDENVVGVGVITRTAERLLPEDIILPIAFKAIHQNRRAQLWNQQASIIMDLVLSVCILGAFGGKGFCTVSVRE